MGFAQTAAVGASWRRSSEDAAITDYLKALLCSNTQKDTAIVDFLAAILCSLQKDAASVNFLERGLLCSARKGVGTVHFRTGFGLHLCEFPKAGSGHRRIVHICNRIICIGCTRR